jgi:hypothetical protein
MENKVELKQFYIRLISYENACKIIDFINSNDKKDYACITTGGVSVQVCEENLDKVMNYIFSLNYMCEITNEHPEKINARIIERLKSKNQI